MNKRYLGAYLVGKQSDWQSFATEMGFTVQSLIDRARRSNAQVAGEYLWLVEVWDLTFSDLLWAWKNNLYPLIQYQAAQLGAPFTEIRGRNGGKILNTQGVIITEMRREAIVWCRALAPDMAHTLTQAQALTYINTNNIDDKLKALFDAFEYTGV